MGKAVPVVSNCAFRSSVRMRVLLRSQVISALARSVKSRTSMPDQPTTRLTCVNISASVYNATITTQRYLMTITIKYDYIRILQAKQPSGFSAFTRGIRNDCNDNCTPLILHSGNDIFQKRDELVCSFSFVKRIVNFDSANLA
jgi:hypothetical protein